MLQEDNQSVWDQLPIPNLFQEVEREVQDWKEISQLQDFLAQSPLTEPEEQSSREPSPAKTQEKLIAVSTEVIKDDSNPKYHRIKKRFIVKPNQKVHRTPVLPKSHKFKEQTNFQQALQRTDDFESNLRTLIKTAAVIKQLSALGTGKLKSMQTQDQQQHRLKDYRD